MDTIARWDLTVRRNDDAWSVPLAVVGLNLTNTALLAEIRQSGDSAALLLSLPEVTDPAATGVRLVGVTTSEGVPTSTLSIQISKVDRQDPTKLLYMGEVGDTAEMAWGLTIGGETRIQGQVYVPAQVVGASGAPANRPAGYGSPAVFGGSSSGATLTVAQDGGATLVIDGAGQLGALVVEAGAARDAAAGSATASAAASAYVSDALDDLLPEGSNLFDKTRAIGGHYVDANGALQPNGDVTTTPPIRVNPGSQIVFSQALYSSGIGAISFLDAARAPVLTLQGSYLDGTPVNVPNTASIRYIQASLAKPSSGGDVNVDTLMVNRGAVVLPWAPFGWQPPGTEAAQSGPQTPEQWVAAIRADDGSLLTPALQIDLDKQRAWLNGARAAIGSVLGATAGTTTPILDAAWKLVAAALAGGYSVAVDYSFPDLYTAQNQPAGCLFATGTPAQGNSRFELTANATTGPDVLAPGGAYDVVPNWSGYGGFTFSAGATITESAQPTLASSYPRRRQGIQRISLSLPFDAVTPGLALDNAGLVVPITQQRGATPVPSAAAIGGAVVFGGEAMANVTVHQVTIYPRRVSAAELGRIGLFNEHRRPGLLFTGDSYNNNAANLDGMLLELKPLGYFPHYWQGHQGRGWNYHLGLLQALTGFEDRFRDYVSSVWDGGLDYQGVPFGTPDTDANGNPSPQQGPWSNLDLLHFMRQARALFREPRWILPESTPNSGSRQAGTTAQNDAAVATLEATMQIYQDTYPEAMCRWVDLLIAQTVAAEGMTADAAFAFYRQHRIVPANMLGPNDDIHMSWVQVGAPIGDGVSPAGSYWIGKALAAKYLRIIGG